MYVYAKGVYVMVNWYQITPSHHELESQINPLYQPSPMLLLPPPSMAPPALILTLTTRVNRIILTLREPILLTPIVRDHSAEHSTLIIRRDAPDHHAIRTRRLVARERPGFKNRELQVWFLGVRE